MSDLSTLKFYFSQQLSLKENKNEISHPHQQMYQLPQATVLTTLFLQWHPQVIGNGGRQIVLIFHPFLWKQGEGKMQKGKGIMVPKAEGMTSMAPLQPPVPFPQLYSCVLFLIRCKIKCDMWKQLSYIQGTTIVNNSPFTRDGRCRMAL